MPRVREIDGYTVVMDYKSPRVSSEIYECGLPITFDQYNKCAFGCRYCFAAFISTGISHATAANTGANAREVLKYRNPVRAVDPDAVKRYWLEMDSPHWRGSDAMMVNLLRQRTPLHWGGLCDPFDPFEEKFKVGLELLLFLRAMDWPVVFSTKGTLMMNDPWASVLRGGNFRFQFSITTLDADKGRISDSGVGTPQERLEAMRFVTRELGCTATLRLRPIIPGVITPEEACELIRQAHAAGATGVSTEFFCLEMRGTENRERYARMSKGSGFDLVEFYRANSPGQSGYLRLNRSYKETFFVPMARTANQLGMRFSVSDMHFKELGNVAGCCGVYWNDEGAKLRDGRDGVFINKGTVTYALMFARDHGEVRWSDMAPHLEWAHERLDANISGMMNMSKLRGRHRAQTMYDVLRSYWNDPNHSKSPYRYSGGKVRPVGVDPNGDVIYVYDENPAVDPEFRQTLAERAPDGRVRLALVDNEPDGPGGCGVERGATFDD